MTLDPYTSLGDNGPNLIGIAYAESLSPPYRFVLDTNDARYIVSEHDTLHEAAQAAAEWIRDNWGEDAPADTWHKLNRIVSDDLAEEGRRKFCAALRECADQLQQADSNTHYLIEAAEVVEKRVVTYRSRMVNMINRGTVRGVDPRAVVVHPEFTTGDLWKRANEVFDAQCRWVEGDDSQVAVAALRAELQREAAMGPEALYWQRSGEDPGRPLGEHVRPKGVQCTHTTSGKLWTARCSRSVGHGGDHISDGESRVQWSSDYSDKDSWTS